MIEPPWLTIARADLERGIKEVAGPGTAPQIQKWLIDLKAWWRDDETPWCGVAQAAWVKGAGVPIPKAFYRAKAWLEWGYELSSPSVGAIVIFERKGGGHVGTVVGRDASGNLMVLGGNQGNRVSIMPFAMERVAGYRWCAPQYVMLPTNFDLPLLASDGKVSTQEA